MRKLNIKELIIPYWGMSKVDYFKFGVLWVLAGDEKPTVRKAEKGEKSTIDDPEIIKTIAEAVPGQKSYLMDLVIKSNVNEFVMYQSNYPIEEKLDKIAASISRFVVTE